MRKQPFDVTLRRKETEKGRKAEQILREAGVSFAIIESETFVPILYWGGKCYVGLPKIQRFAKGLKG